MAQIKNINLIGNGYWGSNINRTLIEMGIDVNVIDPAFGNNRLNVKHPIVIATPTNTHYDIALELINQGCNVLIEKPVATTADQIMKLKYIKKPTQVVMAGHLYLYNPMFEQFKNIIKELGKPKLIHFVRNNFGRYQTDVDVLHNIAFHDFSMLHNMFQTINVTASEGFKLSNETNIDRAIVIGTADTAKFQIEASWLDAKRERTVTFYGEHGQATWDSDADTIKVTRFTIVPFEKTTKLAASGSSNPLREELCHFLDCIEEKCQPNTTLSDAVQIELLINRAITMRNQTYRNQHNID